MKNISKVMLLLVLLCCLSSCNVKYHENSFFSNGILDEELLPKLPEPDAQSMLFVEGNGITENTVYVSSNEETEEDYFQKVLEYTSSLEFEHYGTIHNIKQSFPILGVDPTYYYHSTSILSSLLPSNYYFEEENSYILAYSNGDLKFDADGTNQYIDDAHMIRVCKTPGEYNNDEFTFDYDYYIEFANEPMLWLDDDKQVKTLNTFVMYDYGMHISGKITTLLDGNLIWFDPKDYGIATLIAGDELVIEYTGEFICEESYPGNVAADLMHIQSIEVIEADIVEFTVSAVPGSDELDLVPVDSKYNTFILSNEGYVISQDETFKKYYQYPEGTTLYASLPKSTNSVRVDSLYDYNPREKIIPTGQYQLSIIDKGNDIIDELSHDAGMYTPGSKLEFYSHPIMDVDLAMYVNNEFYKTQDTIEIDGEYMWKYTLFMPAKDVIIEFKTISIEYTDVRNALNIPNISINDIVEVRKETGAIGVAPGMLTNITYSTDMEDKNMLLSLLEMTVYEDVTNNWQIDGGGYTLYSIITNDQRYDIEITNGYISINQKHYKFLGEYVSFEYLSSQAYSFITYLDNATVYRLDWIYSDLVEAEKICEIDNISSLEFVEFDWTSDNLATHEIVTEFDSLYVYDSDVFYYDGKHYKITNDNFSFYEMFK